MRTIFLSYRRDDSEGQAGRLFDDLVEEFGADSVFMDVSGIDAGRDFRKVIDANVASCGVLLAMIGKDWTDVKDKQGRRRIDDPVDFVRLEIASALQRDIPVIPVLVQRASMPTAEQLPADLETFAYRNAVELTHARWDSDVQVLLNALRPIVYDTQPESAAQHETVQVSQFPDHVESGTDRNVKSPPPSPTGKLWKAYILGAITFLTILASGFIGFKYYSDDKAIQAQEKLLEQHDDAASQQTSETRIQLPKVESDVEPGPNVVEPASHDEQLTTWLSEADFMQSARSQPKGSRFPYNFEGRCMDDGRVELRAKFGSMPQGVSSFYFGTGPLKKYEQQANQRESEGYTEFSHQTCKLPSGKIFVQRVFIK